MERVFSLENLRAIVKAVDVLEAESEECQKMYQMKILKEKEEAMASSSKPWSSGGNWRKRSKYQ